MGHRGLLSRIAAGNGTLAPAGSPVSAIAEHLRVLLNTRKGEAAACPGFGILDFNDVVHTYPAALVKMQQSIRAALQAYEPRLKNVTVTYLPSEDEGTQLHFEISAQLNVEGAHGPVHFRTRVNPNGRVELW